MRQHALAAALIALAAAALAHEQHAEARYLGNEGVLVAHADVKVLFDAFYADSYDTYLLVPEAQRAAMLAGRAPYDGIDAVFVSHVHGDHFTAAPTLAYLRAQPDVRLYGPRQVYDALAQAAEGPEDPVLTRIIALDPTPGGLPATALAGPITIEVVAIPHSGGERMMHIRNLAFRITLGQWPTVLHMGDAGAVDAYFEPLQPYWDAKRTHMVFSPYWFFDSETGRTILETRIRADQAIGIHVPAEALGNGDAWRANAGGDLFTDPGETRSIR